MTDDIKTMVSRFQDCLRLRPPQLMEPLVQSSVSRPFESVSIDLGCTAWLLFWLANDKVFEEIKHSSCDKDSRCLGKPVKLRSDSGPQFHTEFDDWLQDQDIIHELSSPYKHQSNSHAEVAVWNIKIYWPRLAATGQGWPQLAQLLTGAERMA